MTHPVSFLLIITGPMMPTAVEVVRGLAAELLHGVGGVGPLQHQAAAVQMGAVTQRVEGPLK